MIHSSIDRRIKLYGMFSIIFAFLTIAAFVTDMLITSRGLTMIFPFWLLGIKKFFDIRYERQRGKLSLYTIITSSIIFLIDAALIVLFLITVFTPIPA